MGERASIRGYRRRSRKLVALLAASICFSVLFVALCAAMARPVSRNCGSNFHVGENIHTVGLTCAKGIGVIKAFNRRVHHQCSNGQPCQVGTYSCLVRVPSLKGHCITGYHRVTWRVGR
jgi:hypothetical protein